MIMLRRERREASLAAPPRRGPRTGGTWAPGSRNWHPDSQPPQMGVRDSYRSSHARVERVPFAVHEWENTLELVARGEWDLSQQAVAQQAIGGALARHPGSVVLDLSLLSFIDASGVHAVLDLHQSCLQQDIHLVIIPGVRAVQRLFEICGLIGSLPFLRSEA